MNRNFAPRPTTTKQIETLRAIQDGSESNGDLAGALRITASATRARCSILAERGLIEISECGSVYGLTKEALDWFWIDREEQDAKLLQRRERREAKKREARSTRERAEAAAMHNARVALLRKYAANENVVRYLADMLEI